MNPGFRRAKPPSRVKEWAIDVLSWGLLICLGPGSIGLSQVLEEERDRLEGFQPTPAIVVSSEQILGWGGHGRKWKVAIDYRYEIDGREHGSRGVESFHRMDGYSAERSAASYVPGETVEVWVNPEDPTESLLDTNLGPAPVFFLATGIVVTGFLLVFGIGSALEASKSRGRSRQTQLFRPSLPGHRRDRTGSGTETLRVGDGRTHAARAPSLNRTRAWTSSDRRSP